MDYSGKYDEYRFGAEFYDSVPLNKERIDVAFYVEMARKYKGTVLEIGCGTGRILIPTARAGITITGFDMSESMLSVCKEKLSTESDKVQSKVTLKKADMRRFDFKQTFKLITTPFRSFQHLTTVDEQLSCLSCICKHLNDDGIFILDLFNPSLPFLVDDKYLTEQDESDFSLQDGRKVKRNFRIISRDYFNQIQDIELVYYVTHSDGKTERLVDRFLMRYIFPYEAEHLLERSGFRVEKLYGDYNKTPYGSNYPGELVFITRKA